VSSGAHWSSSALTKPAGRTTRSRAQSTPVAWSVSSHSRASVSLRRRPASQPHRRKVLTGSSRALSNDSAGTGCGLRFGAESSCPASCSRYSRAPDITAAASRPARGGGLT
jgi:hypothetical protein